MPKALPSVNAACIGRLDNNPRDHSFALSSHALLLFWLASLRTREYSLRMPITSLTQLSLSQLQRALVLKATIEALETELADVLAMPTAEAAPAKPPKKKRRVSAAGRAAIRRAARRRWAKVRASKIAAPGAVAKPAKKRQISAAGRKRIAAAQRARWAKLKAAKPAA